MPQQIHGNTEGIRNTLLSEMAQLYDMEIPEEDFAPRELIALLAEYSAAINREIAVYIARDGEVVDIMIGENDQVALPSVRLRRSENRLSRIRVLHTHPGGSAKLSAVDLNALRQLRLDAISAIGVSPEGQPTGISAAFICGWDGEKPLTEETDIYSPWRFPGEEWMSRIAEYDRAAPQTGDTQERPERAMLLSIRDDTSFQELRALAESAGAEVVSQMVQKRAKPESATYIGSGKAAELALAAQAADATMILCDDELTGVQLHNLEELTGVKVVDRTNLILDIFAQRARTREGKLQVSLAQLKYQMTHLIGFGVSLSRLAGGIGTRGPGETKLEMDRRAIRRRYTLLQKELSELKAHRELQRKARKRSEVRTVALVGYTNAGKSTLFNRLADGQVLVMDQLFATLDATTRRVEPDKGLPYLLTDTVGFITNLPTDLVEAFQSTLEEAALADLLLIVTDASNPDSLAQRRVVDEVLEKLGATAQPRLEVLNKVDRALPEIVLAFPDAVQVCALTGEGTDVLLEAIQEKLQDRLVTVTLRIPYDKMKVSGLVRTYAQDVSETYEDACLRAEAVFTEDQWQRFSHAVRDVWQMDENSCQIHGGE